MKTKIGRNDLCPCGSGKKYKRCCLDKDEADNANPDFEDPFAPDLNSEDIVKCLHCGDEYKEKEIKWSKTTDMWVCKNYPRCDGTGLGFDIHRVDDNIENCV